MTTEPQRKSTRTPTDSPKSPQRVKSAKEEVVITSFEDLMNENVAKLRACTDRYNALVVSSDAKDRDHVVFLASLHDQIGKAISAHSAVATAINDNKQVSPAEIEEAVAATTAVKQLEDEWKTNVDKTLANHESRIDALEDKNKVPVLAPVPTPEPEAVIVPPTPESADATTIVNNGSHSSVTLNGPVLEPRRSALPASGLQWLLAVILGLIGFAIGWSTKGLITANIWEWTQILLGTVWVLALIGIGFYLGGLIGFLIQNRDHTAE